eukprot:g15874.t2
MQPCVLTPELPTVPPVINSDDVIDLKKYNDLLDEDASWDRDELPWTPVAVPFPPTRRTHEKYVRRINRFLLKMERTVLVMASKIIRVKREGFSSETLQLRTTAPLHTQLADAVGLPPLFAFRMVDENGKDVLEAFEALEAGREYTIYPYHVEPEKPLLEGKPLEHG